MEDGLDAQVLLQTAATAGSIDDICPSDIMTEAVAFWTDFFNTECHIAWEDVPKSFKTDIENSAAFHPELSDGPESKGCRIVTPLADVSGSIAFDILPPPVEDGVPTGESWSGQLMTAIRQMSLHGKLQEAKGQDICEIFSDGIPRLVDIPVEKINEVFDQVKADYARTCKVQSIGGALILETDTSLVPIGGKRSMADADGKSVYSFVLSVSAPGKDALDIMVHAEEDPLLDSDTVISTANEAFERLVKETAEERDDEMKGFFYNSGAHPHLLENGDFADEAGYTEPSDSEEHETDTASYIQGRLHVQGRPSAGSGLQHSGSGIHQTLPEKPLPMKGAPPEQRPSEEKPPPIRQDPQKSPETKPITRTRLIENLGSLRVQDDLTTPLLCCLCDACMNPEACTLGADGLISPGPSLIDDDEAKVREQEHLYPELAPNMLLQVETAKAGSDEEHRPPPIPGDIKRRSDFRIRAEPGYGDNFHALILPQRTAEDHKLVWAQSRALIETVKAEGINISKSYHFYDSDDTAKCFQQAYNQGKCGSCWAFASLGALEKQICLRSKGDVPASMSREMLVRCSEQNFGCEGGNADKAYEDLMEIGGVFSTDCLPYQGKGSKHCPVFAYSWNGQGSAGKTGKFARIDQEMQQSCGDHTRYSNRPPQGREWDMPFQMMYEARFGTLPDVNDPRLERYRRNFAKMRSRDRVPSWWLYGEEAMKAAVVKYGSIYSSFKVRNDFKGRQCSDGCWPPGTTYGEEPQFKPATCGCGKGHAVHIIGYGEDIQETGTKVPYWLIENSWGSTKHGNVVGHDIDGAEGFGKDPFTEEHPMGLEEKCLFAGWAFSALPRTGGCSGNANINLRDDVAMKNGPPDGMVLSLLVDGVMKGNWSVKEDSVEKISLALDMLPGRQHNVTLQVYAKNHPKQQSFDVETYGIMAMSLRCRGRGFRYSFTQNDTKASLSWGRKTRSELKAEADNLIPTNQDPEYLYGKCPEACRTGRYSFVKPCLGLLADWGSCYTESWALTSSYMLSRKRAMCTDCAENILKVEQKAYALRKLDNATFMKWFKLVEESWDAPDDAGWMRSNTGSCKVKGGGFSHNAMLSATYVLDVPSNRFCDERHSAPYAQGKFVHAPGHMNDQEKKTTRCPPPMVGEVLLQCRRGALYALSHHCGFRPGTADGMGSSRGYYKMLRGSNYHGIESGAAFAIAEMNRFANRCPTLSWSRWSECNVSTPCAKGVQHRTRNPIGLSKTDPRCANIMFNDTRSCVGPGFCPQILTRFSAKGSEDISEFLAEYKRASTTIKSSNNYATAGSTMMPTATPSCDDAQYWCKVTTGKTSCAMYMEGHFTVLKDAEYYLHYETEGGGGILEFNALGEGKETDPQYQVRGGASSSMHEWQDLGFHHRRRRSDSKPWERISSMKLSKGTYYARMTRTGWSKCPTYTLRLEQLSAKYKPPLLLGASANKTAAALTNGLFGGAKQKKVKWWNNWGAISSWIFSARGRYGSSYAPKSEEGNMNELVFRSERGGNVLKRVPITKFNFTADELYKLIGVNKLDLPESIKRWAKYELVLRSTVILPEQGEYVFKFQMDNSYSDADAAWSTNSRRRHSKFHIRVGVNPATGTGGALATIDASQGSASKSVSFHAQAAGTVPFEASIIPPFTGPGDKFSLPKSIVMEVKRKDMLHGSSLEIGSKTNYMSDLDAIRGDTEVRIDWPERDDPLSSELKTQTFQALDPHALLIGKTGLAGFQALAEAKIDAGACTSVEAWASGVDRTSRNITEFWGIGMNLCDVDGNNQFLELVTYHPPDQQVANMTSVTKNRVGWVHVGFIQPTHMQIIRDPITLGKFSFGYRPDNREQFATPFAPIHTGFVGGVDVGVSMNSHEAYRYAEFYNVSIEECPASCNDTSGKQLFCGEILTPCGNKLQCGTACGNGDVCKGSICMKCPTINLTASQKLWECGTVEHVCTNHLNQKVQVHREVGTVAQPTMMHFCENHTWECVGKSKWAFLTEGKECGSERDNCNTEVDLFRCPHDNDQCEAHKCVCYPSTFSVDFNCGSEGDGCGNNVTFGDFQGKCSGASDRCLAHKCCTPKTKNDFPSSYQCGSEPDGCDGMVEFEQAPASAFFIKAPTSTTYNSNYGKRGIEIKATENVTLISVARGVMEGKSNLSTTSPVGIWDVETKIELGRVDVGPAATVKDGYAWEKLPRPVKLEKGKKYRIVMNVWRNMADKYTASYLYGSNLDSTFRDKFAKFQGVVQSYDNAGFPEDSHINANAGVGTVNFDVVENDGCGAGLWTCHSNHSCTKKVVKGFQVKTGPCVVSGNCVTSQNFGSDNYKNGEKCKILSPSEGVMKAVTYKTESYYDYLTIDGTEYRYSTPPSMTLTASKSIEWYSDGSVTRDGWKLCVDSSFLQEGMQSRQGKQQEQQELQEVQLDESMFAELPEDEQQHALNKHRQRLQDQEAAKTAAAAAMQEEEKDMQIAKTMFAEKGPAPLVFAEEDVSEDVALTDDELALPDLTQK